MKVAQISESEFSIKGHGVHTAFIETTRALKQRGDVTVVVNSRESADIRHLHTVGLYCWQQLLFCHGKKVISAHVIPESFIGSLRWAESWLWLAKWYLRLFYNRADQIIAVSDSTKQELEKLGVKRPISVLYNMIDTKQYRASDQDRVLARRACGIAKDAFVVASNGQVQPRKRVDMFVEMAKKLPDVTFVWIGGIPFKGAAAHYEKMKRLMKDAPSDVIFTDVVPLEQVKQYLHAADVFVMPSDQETFGLAIVEAAAAGLPVILRDLHDYDTTFREYAAIADTADAFVAVITRLRAESSYYKAAVQQSARLAHRYDSEVIAEQLVSLYTSLLK